MLIRAKYYGGNDMSTSLSLQRAEEVIIAYKASTETHDVNDIIEYYNIIQFFDNKIYHPDWDDAKRDEYAKTVNMFRAEVGRFLHSIQGNDLAALYNQIEARFRSDFINLLSHYKVTDRISDDQFSGFIDAHPQAMAYIIQNKSLVVKYGSVIIEQLKTKERFAELVLQHFYVRHDYSDRQKTYMPVDLDKTLINSIIRKYVEWEDASTNYLQLISGLKKAGEYPVEDKTRLKASKRVRAFWKEHFKSGNTGMKVAVEISILDQEAVVLEEFDDSDGMTHRLSYSKKWISDNLDYSTLLNNFIYLFNFTDQYYRCQFLSNPNDLSVIERISGIHGNDEYTTGIGYESLKMKSSLQMFAYRKELHSHNIEVEDLFKWFFEEYLKTEFGVENYKYCVPSPSASSLEKILLMASQLDSVLKQFRLFIADDVIDRELFEFSSSPYKIVDTPSMIERKYLYPLSDEIKRDIFCLFSDQCLLSYSQKTSKNYNSLMELMLHEDIKPADYPEFAIAELNRLLDRGAVFADENGVLRIKRSVFRLLSDMYRNGNVCFSYCTDSEKQLAKVLLKRGDLEVESSLFTRQEKDYLDYMLNVQQFVNGPELRNKYVHGNYSLDPHIHESDYIELLKIMTLIVLKINEEFCLKYPSESGSMVVVS